MSAAVAPDRTVTVCRLASSGSTAASGSAIAVMVEPRPDSPVRTNEPIRAAGANHDQREQDHQQSGSHASACLTPLRIEIVLQDHGGGDGVHLAGLPRAARVAALSAENRLGLAGAEPLIPQGDGHAQYTFGNAGKLRGATGLRALRSRRR